MESSKRREKIRELGKVICHRFCGDRNKDIETCRTCNIHRFINDLLEMS